jgi:hypothetical protein
VNDTVGVDHWQDVELKLFEQLRSELVGLAELPDDAFDDEGTDCFAGVLTSDDDDGFLGLRAEFAEFEERENVVGNRVANSLDLTVSG